jgi:hypothetical protein
MHVIGSPARPVRRREREGVCDMINNDLLQTVLGHLALLEQKYPKKAASPVAKRLKRCLVRSGGKDERRGTR